jgi:phage baseplate assembly protein V
MFASRDHALNGNVGNPEMNDAERRLANIAKAGRVVQADYPKALVKVGIGDPEDPEDYIITGWLPMAGGRSDEWNPLRIGEAVLVLAESGELENGIVTPGSIYNEDHPAVGDRGDLYRKKFPDGSVIEYDEAAGSMKLTGAQKFDAQVGEAKFSLDDTRALVKFGDATITVQNGTIVLSAGGQTFVVGSAGSVSSGKIKGNNGLEVSGDSFTHNGHDVGENHRHTQVQPGTGNTGKPQ